MFSRLHFGAFQDIFWRLKLKHPEKVVASCPDVMFNIYEQEIPDEKYDALAQKWDVKKWVESNGQVRWYGCRRGGHAHDSKSSCGIPATGLAVPPCDLENLADIVKFIMKECENAGIYCQLNAGTLLGNVLLCLFCNGEVQFKLSLFPPFWDLNRFVFRMEQTKKFRRR